MSKDNKSNIQELGLNFLGFAEKSKPRYYINVGSLFDIPTGTFVTGAKGETITNGGLGPIIGFGGKGNYFKSTIAHYFALSAANRSRESGFSGSMMLYDTEMNISYDRLNRLASHFPNLPEEPTTSGVWNVTSKDILPGDIFFEKLSDALKAKAKEDALKVKYDCFVDPFTKKASVNVDPTIITIDSFSELEGSISAEKLEGNLDDKSTKTFAMEQGMFKTKLSSRLPGLSSNTNTHFILVAQVGEKMDIGGPLYGPAPVKDLQHLRSDFHLKGVGSKFFFLTTQLWVAVGASALMNQGTKEPEYPVDSNDKSRSELNIVKLTLSRNKNGPSGDTIEVIVSQADGVLPHLTQFHYIKERDRFGLVGNNVSYSLALRPDVKLSRTTVRGKLDSDPLLRRAVSITADLLQIKLTKPGVIRDDLWCDPSTLYEDIKKLGYDWDVLLNTRDYWLANQYSPDVLPFLSTMDLLRMRKGLYTPYFLKDKK